MKTDDKTIKIQTKLTNLFIDSDYLKKHCGIIVTELEEGFQVYVYDNFDSSEDFYAECDSVEDAIAELNNRTFFDTRR